MIYIEKKKYIIVKGTDEVLCGASNDHIFVKINNLGKKNIVTYSSFGKAYSTILRCGYAKHGVRVVEVTQTIIGEKDGSI